VHIQLIKRNPEEIRKILDGVRLSTSRFRLRLKIKSKIGVKIRVKIGVRTC